MWGRRVGTEDPPGAWRGLSIWDSVLAPTGRKKRSGSTRGAVFSRLVSRTRLLQPIGTITSKPHDVKTICCCLWQVGSTPSKGDVEEYVKACEENGTGAVASPCCLATFPSLRTAILMAISTTSEIVLLAFLFSWLQTLGRSQSLGWIVVGNTGLPTCSYCVNAINATSGNHSALGYSGLRVGIYRCLKFDSNEQWAIDNATNTIQIQDPTNNTLCIEAGLQSDYEGGNVTLLPMQLSACDGSSNQQWFFDNAAKTVRSGLTDSGGGPVYMVVADLPSGQAQESPAYFNLYLSTLQAPGFRFSQLTFVPASSLRNNHSDLFLNIRSADPGQNSRNLFYNGGFARSTLLGSWPSGVNCSKYSPTACSKLVFFDGEVFSLCSWGIENPPKMPLWINNRAPWKAAEGNSALLLPGGVSINQTIPIQPNSSYTLSFSLAGFLTHDAISDSYHLCSDQTGNVTVTAAGVQLAAFSVDEPSTDLDGIIWFRKTFTFFSSGSATVISFNSIGFSQTCGPVLDDVGVILPYSSHRLLKVVAAAVASFVFAALVLVLTALVLSRRKKVSSRTSLGSCAFEEKKVSSRTSLGSSCSAKCQSVLLQRHPEGDR